ncbi:chromosome segregation protein SMC [Bdellovibrionota bacterium FG-1]
MRIKRLEIQGFKSFKDKTLIHFDHGITGIVGPNGCGKSNVVDAFFWVMGEQSYKHMRGSSSDDLIFNGSSKYNPLGMAEATLVLETDAADTESAPAGASAADIPVHLRSKEISVTRRLYRGGEGEYFINGVPARLKDIHDLFMDTGVGAKGYSVIEQGQIGKIVQAKPEERRLLIEEAAGIAKYKARKKESLRKMEATQGNLSRLTDVIQEIERSLGSLDRQAQKARQYKKYKEELLDKEMTWGRRKNTVLRQKLEMLAKQKEQLEQELVGLRAELQTAENTIETDRVDQVTDTKAAEELQAQINHCSSELAHERSALELSRQRQSDLHQQLSALDHEKSELKNSIEEERLKLENREIEASESNDLYQEASVQAQSADQKARQARNEADGLRRDLENRKRELMKGISQASDLTSRAASLASRIESAQAQAERLKAQVSEQHEKLAVTREETQRASENAESVKMKREELQVEKRAQADRVQGSDQNTRKLDRERDDSHRKLTQLKSKLQSLEELAAAYEGLGDGPKAALEWARDNGQADQLLALTDALDVTGEFETALGGLLEKRLENLIARDTNAALGAIQHVAHAKQGRIAIQVASGLEGRQAGAWDAVRDALTQSGFEVLGQLTDQVTINAKLDSKVQAIASGLIAHVAVVRSFEPMARFISGSAGGTAMEQLAGWSVVSQEGDALDYDGTLRGGSTESDGAATVLKRKRAITDLQAQVEQAELAHQSVENAAMTAKVELEEARTRLQTVQTELQQAEIQGAAFERDVHQMSRALREAENHAERLQSDLLQMEEQGQSARIERENIEDELAAIVSSRSDLEAQISAGDDEMALRDTEVRAQEVEAQALKMNEVTLRERAQSLKRELETGRTLIADRARRLAEIDRTLDRATREREQHTGGEGGIEEKIEELTIQLSTAREQLSEVKDRLEKSGAELNRTLERIKQFHKTGDHKTSESNQVGLEIERISGDLQHLVQNLEEKYGPGCLELPVTSPIQEEMTDPVVTHEMTAEEEQVLGEEVERLRERIRRLGEVNVGAIEEFENTKKRFDHLESEKLDLERSLENLQDAIEHINKTSEERFVRAFEAIKDRFERLFPIVFGGGKAELTLVYPEGSKDVLEAGVDILAQPPGKKVVNMTLLSGGEKALTAVAFIFAIFMVKPSPFCLLDEVDAPLDDANIGKFNALLREMSAKSQFIVITHNKKTMELNDTLYGVTMEEPGVSKMISIELQ